MKIKTILLLIMSALLIISSFPSAFATEYVFDENGVVIAEIENTTSGYVFDENGVVIAEPEENTSDDYDDTSVGIIGGADGPTAIFVSGGSSLFLFAALAIAAVSLAIIIIVTLKRKRKNK